MTVLRAASLSGLTYTPSTGESGLWPLKDAISVFVTHEFFIANIADRCKLWKVQPSNPARFLNFANSRTLVLTILLVVIVWYIFSTTEGLAQQETIIQNVIYIELTAVLFWFGDWAMRPKK